MKDIQRLATALTPYVGRLFLFFVLANLMMIFNFLSYIVSAPFLQVLFTATDTVVQRPASVTDIDSANQFVEYWLGTYIIENGQQQAIILLCGAIIIIYFFKNFFRYLSVFTIIPVRFGVAKTLRDRLFKKVTDLPLSFFAEEKKGNIMVKMTNDVEEFRLHTVSMIESILRDPIAIILPLVTLFSISTYLTYVSFGLVLFIGLVVGLVGATLRQKSKKAQAKMGDLTSTLEETIGGLRIIKAFNAAFFQSEKFEKENNDHRNLLTSIWWRMASASPLTEFLGAVTLCCLLIVGGSMVAKNEIRANEFLIFVGAFWSMISPLKTLFNSFFNIKKGLGAADRIYELLNISNNITERDNPIPIDNFQYEITYDQVSFAYNTEREVLKKVSFNLKKGRILAIVGASGSGKSTLIDLLPRFYDISKGTISIDGQSIKNYKLEDLRGLMGIVSQEPILFNDTIEKNISFGLENISREEIINAAKTANAYDFIKETPEGFETIIGDKGVKLSGGQRQRLTIARAVLRNPQILILDEATSSLDSKSEQLVQDALSKLMVNRTAIVIAHRLSTIQNADEILVMKEGEIIERGTHQSLIVKNGAYKKLVELQVI